MFNQLDAMYSGRIEICPSETGMIPINNAIIASRMINLISEVQWHFQIIIILGPSGQAKTHFFVGRHLEVWLLGPFLISPNPSYMGGADGYAACSKGWKPRSPSHGASSNYFEDDRSTPQFQPRRA